MTTITLPRETVQQALDEILYAKQVADNFDHKFTVDDDVIAALRAALSETEIPVSGPRMLTDAEIDQITNNYWGQLPDLRLIVTRGYAEAILAAAGVK